MQTQSNLGAGELSTIVLAAEMNADLTLIDDSQARRMAQEVSLSSVQWAYSRQLFTAGFSATSLPYIEN